MHYLGLHSTFDIYEMYGAVNSTLSSLALDSSRGLLYFTDPGRGSLGVLSTDGFADSPNVLIAGADEKPTAIAVDSANRHLFSLRLNMYYYIIRTACYIHDLSGDEIMFAVLCVSLNDGPYMLLLNASFYIYVS